MSLRILLADDSMTAQNMGKKILSDAGYEVIAVSNGAAAAKKIPDMRPDIAVLDIYMPGYTGLEVSERVKNAPETAHIPVLLTVGKLEPYQPEQVAKARAEGVIIKPFEASDLLAAVKKIAERCDAQATVAAQNTVSAPPVRNEFQDQTYKEWIDDTQDDLAEEASVAQAMAAVASTGGLSGSANAPVFQIEDTQPLPMMARGDVLEQHVAGTTNYDETIWAPGETNAQQDASASAPIFGMQDAAAVAAAVEMPAMSAPAVQNSDVPAYLAEFQDEAPAITLDYVTPPSTFEPTIAPAEHVTAAPAADVEFNSAPHAADLEVAAAEGLETNEQNATGAVASVDPALVTDPTELSAFAIKVGTDEPNMVVGTVTDAPSEVADALMGATGELTDESEQLASSIQIADPGDETAALPAAVDACAAIAEELMRSAEMEAASDGPQFENAAELPAIEHPVEHIAKHIESFKAEPSVTMEVAHESQPDAEVASATQFGSALAGNAAIEIAMSPSFVEETLASSQITAPVIVEPVDEEQIEAPVMPEQLATAALAEVVQPAPAVDVEEITEPEPSARDTELAASLAAALDSMGTPVEAAVTDEQASKEAIAAQFPSAERARIAAAVERVVDRHKAQIIADILRELANE